jgi:hypothetical protein
MVEVTGLNDGEGVGVITNIDDDGGLDIDSEILLSLTLIDGIVERIGDTLMSITEMGTNDRVDTDGETLMPLTDIDIDGPIDIDGENLLEINDIDIEALLSIDGENILSLTDIDGIVERIGDTLPPSITDMGTNKIDETDGEALIALADISIDGPIDIDGENLLSLIDIDIEPLLDIDGENLLSLTDIDGIFE